jgi:hypothetical protein
MEPVSPYTWYHHPRTTCHLRFMGTTRELFRRDALNHNRHLESEAAQHERNIQAILAEIRRRTR